MNMLIFYVKHDIIFEHLILENASKNHKAIILL